MILLQGDCLEVMKTLPDKSIDLFLCDLPYGCLTNQKGESKGFWRPSHAGTTLEGSTKYMGGNKLAWDIKIDLEQFWIQVERLMKDEHTPIIHFCNARFGYELIKSKENWFRYDLIWNKNRGVGFLLANKQPMRSHENIYVFSKKGARYYRKDIEGDFKKSHSRGNAKIGNTNVYNGGNPLPIMPDVDNSKTRCVLSIVEVNGNGRTRGNHPTQKPDDLYAWLIERYSKEGDTILDPTAGSFASVFTAERLKRNGIGIEKDEAFYSKAKTNGETSR